MIKATLTVGSLFCMICAILLLLPKIVAAPRWLMDVYDSPALKLGMTLIIAVAGYAAYELKRFHQAFYGVVEVMFGIVSECWICFHIPNPIDADLGQWTSLFGAMYIIVRGFTNMSDSKRKESELLVWKILPAIWTNARSYMNRGVVLASKAYHWAFDAAERPSAR